MILQSSPRRERQFLLLGGVSGFLSVALGAFGAHALRDALPADRLAAFDTGVRWQAVHTLALLAAGLFSGRGTGPFAPAAGWLFLLGIAVFSGSLYVLALSGVRGWGAVTPVGGVAWLAGWACLALAGLRRRDVVFEIDAMGGEETPEPDAESAPPPPGRGGP
jgi:uncharacterized membrane protein YgdD (TMEM256/DUF423 family)